MKNTVRLALAAVLALGVAASASSAQAAPLRPAYGFGQTATGGPSGGPNQGG